MNKKYWLYDGGCSGQHIIFFSVNEKEEHECIMLDFEEISKDEAENICQVRLADNIENGCPEDAEECITAYEARFTNIEDAYSFEIAEDAGIEFMF